MPLWRPRSDPVRIFMRRVLLASLVVITTVGLSGVWGAYNKESESAALRRQAELQLSDLAARQAQLNADIAKLKTDRGLEEVLREQYALAARGEQLIMIVDSPTPTPSAATSSILEKIKNFIWRW